MSTDELRRLLPTELATLRKREAFDLLKDIGLSLTSMLGKSCEVVIHDVSDLEHSIIWISGDVTGRKIGGMMPEVALERLRKGETHPIFNYTVHTERGKTLRSCRIWLRDSEGQTYGAFCINLDVTAIATLQDLVLDLARDALQPGVGEAYPQVFEHLHDMLDTMMAEAEYRIGTRAQDMDKDLRVELVRFLDRKGAFQVRNSAAIVANRLGVSRKTIYNYLGEIARDQAAGAESSS